MGNRNILEWIKWIVNGISWKCFLWAIDKTETQYWNEIYDQEVRYLMEKESYLMIERGFMESILRQFTAIHYDQRTDEVKEIIKKMTEALNNRRP